MESVTTRARTNKLYCSHCKRKIKKGELVEFEMENRRMQNVFCEDCGNIDYEFDRHPYDIDD